MIVLKNISFTLTPSSIDRAAAEVRLLYGTIRRAMQSLIDYLGEKGVEIARAELLWVGGRTTDNRGDELKYPEENPAYETGNLSESIQYMKDDGKGTISAGEGLTNAMGVPTNYAIYVEYGTGYTKPNGWWYPDPDGWREFEGQMYSWTPGMEPRPFMQHTYEDLIEEAEANGARVIAEYVRGERV